MSAPRSTPAAAFARSARHAARRVGAEHRALPNFVIIGTQRGGTTSLYAYLCAHPQVRAASKKEIHFFDVHYDRGPQWYRAHFPWARTLRAHRTVTGEASPYYLAHPLAPHRAHDLVPQARLIALLRDPVERAWSHYRHEVETGRESLSFADALAAEPDRLGGAEDDIRAGVDSPRAQRHRRCSYATRGRYAEQLKRWLTYYPSTSLLVLASEDLFARPASAFAEVEEFLGLPHATDIDFRRHNPGISDDMPATSRKRLQGDFATANAALPSLVGREFAWF